MHYTFSIKSICFKMQAYMKEFDNLILACLLLIDDNNK